MEHRKLFPTSSATNQTDCPDFCDPSCPYGCYPYPDYFTPPPLPPPPPPPPSTGHAPPYVIIVVSLLASFFLLVSFYVIIVKYCSRWNLFRPPPTQSDGQDEEFVDENQGPPIDHPIWYIATVGLQPSIINSITVFRYKKGDHLIELTECSVCLSEFQEDETLRLLPKCNHAFHIPCIDTWLRSHTNCPLCRASIVIVSNTESPNEETEDETEDEVELPEADDERKESENSKEVVNSNGHEDFRAIVDLDDNNMILEDEIQPVRRSVSMDSSSAAANIGLAVSSFSMVESEGSLVNQKEDLGIENSSLNRLILGSSSIEQSLHKSPISLKRSFSYSGRLFLSRHSRSSSSILPL